MKGWVGRAMVSAMVLLVSSHPWIAAAEGNAAVAPQIEVSVDCHSSPERVSITNNRGRPVRLRRISSTYQRCSGEPYRLKKVLRPGESVTFTFGLGKGGKRLSKS